MLVFDSMPMSVLPNPSKVVIEEVTKPSEEEELDSRIIDPIKAEFLGLTTNSIWPGLKTGYSFYVVNVFGGGMFNGKLDGASVQWYKVTVIAGQY